MINTDKRRLHESRRHGTNAFPMEFFNTTNENGQLFVNLHWHKNIEILLIRKGSCSVTISRNEYEAKQGDIFIINSEELHRISSEDKQLSYGAFIFPTGSLIFSAPDSADRTLRLLEEGSLLFPEYISADDKLSKKLHELLESILAAEKSGHAGCELFIKAQLLCLFAELIRHDRLVKPYRAADEELKRKNSRLKNILTFINDNCTEPLSLADMAKRFHVSEKYFSRMFSAETGQSFTEYLNIRRIEKACTLLRDTDMSVLDTALESGYENVSYFIRMFRRHKGCTPLKYRRSSQSVGQN